MRDITEATMHQKTDRALTDNKLSVSSTLLSDVTITGPKLIRCNQSADTH